MSEINENEVVTAEDALLHMPLVTTSMLTRLRHDGNGPKFAMIGNRIYYRVSDLRSWYANFQKSMFTQTKSISRRRRGKDASVKAPKSSKARASTAADMLA